MSRRLAARALISLVVASMLLTDLGLGMWHAPRATAQTAAPYHWARKQSHFRLRIGDNVEGDWNGYLREVLADWNQNETVTLLAVDGATTPQYCQPVAGRVEVCDWWYGTQTGWLGLTADLLQCQWRSYRRGHGAAEQLVPLRTPQSV